MSEPGPAPLEVRPRPARRLLSGLRPLSSHPVVLRLDRAGVAVRNSLTAGDDGWARLAWSDCAAVVVSPVRPLEGQRDATYVQFVAHDERAIEGSEDWDAVGGRALLCGLSRSAARLVWMELPGGRSAIPAILDRARAEVPGLRVVGHVG